MIIVLALITLFSAALAYYNFRQTGELKRRVKRLEDILPDERKGMKNG